MVDVHFKSYFLGRLSVGPREAPFFQDKVQSALCSDTTARLSLGLTASHNVCSRQVDLIRLFISALKPAFNIFYKIRLHGLQC